MHRLHTIFTKTERNSTMMRFFEALVLCMGLLFLFSCGQKQVASKGLTPEYMEQLEAIVSNVDGKSDSVRATALLGLLDAMKDDSSAYKEAVRYLQPLLSNPNSPFRNEHLHITLLNELIVSPWYIAAEQEVFLQKRKLASQNRVGFAANDFNYYTPEGAVKTLYGVDAKNVLLFFYNPECPACKETKEKLVQSKLINRKSKVVAIYTDRDESIWRKHLPELPTAWIHGRDSAEYLWKNKLYDLKAIPTVYLLDKNKMVLLKDCQDVRMIEEVLSGNASRQSMVDGPL